MEVNTACTVSFSAICHLRACFSAASSLVRVAHIRTNPSGRRALLASLFQLEHMERVCLGCFLFLISSHFPQMEDVLSIYIASGFCSSDFAPSRSKKWLTLKGPLPSLWFKANHSSQHVRSI